MERVRVVDNAAVSGDRVLGGGVSLFRAAGTVRSLVVAGNVAGGAQTVTAHGGGVYMDHAGTGTDAIEIRNADITGNTTSAWAAPLALSTHKPRMSDMSIIIAPSLTASPAML